MGQKEILGKKPFNAAQNITSHPAQIKGDVCTWPLAFKDFYREVEVQKSEVKVWPPKFKTVMWKNLCVSAALPSAVILLFYFQVN